MMRAAAASVHVLSASVTAPRREGRSAVAPVGPCGGEGSPAAMRVTSRSMHRRRCTARAVVSPARRMRRPRRLELCHSLRHDARCLASSDGRGARAAAGGGVRAGAGRRRRPRAVRRRRPGCGVGPGSWPAAPAAGRPSRNSSLRRGAAASGAPTGPHLVQRRGRERPVPRSTRHSNVAPPLVARGAGVRELPQLALLIGPRPRLDPPLGTPRCGHRPGPPDQRDQHRVGDERGFRQLQADVVRGQLPRGDAGADHGGHQQPSSRVPRPSANALRAGAEPTAVSGSPARRAAPPARRGRRRTRRCDRASRWWPARSRPGSAGGG